MVKTLILCFEDLTGAIVVGTATARAARLAVSRDRHRPGAHQICQIGAVCGGSSLGERRHSPKRKQPPNGCRSPNSSEHPAAAASQSRQGPWPVLHMHLRLKSFRVRHRSALLQEVIFRYQVNFLFMAGLTSKNVRLLVIGCAVLLACNLLFYFHEGNVAKFEFKVLEDLGDISHNTKKPDAGYILRKYLDDRKNGLVVFTRRKGVVEQDDFETQDLSHIYTEQQKATTPFQVVEITAYDPADVPQLSGPQSLDQARGYPAFLNAFKVFIESIMVAVDQAAPSVGLINNDEHYMVAKTDNKFPNRQGRVPVYGGHWREAYKGEAVRTKEFLENFLRPTPEEVSSIRKSHRQYEQAMPKDYPNGLLDHGRQFGFMEGDGIVYLGGGKYNQLVLTSLSVLRATGSKLPVEVILPERKDFDFDLCNNVLPAFNGRCKVMTDYIPELLMKRISGFQLKNVALLVSSFRNVLYLDADNIPVKNPDTLFVNEPFKSKRMVLWPDLWRRSTSPHFYDICEISVDTNTRVRNSYFGGDERGKSENAKDWSYHDCKGAIPEASSETGQLLIDKKTHIKTLILSMYYNFYGPGYYYPLLSQGAAGEGDKETFIAAAHKLGKPYYQVNEFNREFGPLQGKNKHEFFGMGQYDPIIDYIESQGVDRIEQPTGESAQDSEDSSKNQYGRHYYKSYSLMFLHANWPKFYIEEMFKSNSGGRGPIDGNGNRRRLYTDFITKETHGYDLEIEIMRHIKLWYCTALINLANVPQHDTEDRKKICDSIQEQIAFLSGKK